MANNVYRFRHLKWGDPDAKLKIMASTTPKAAKASDQWEIVGIVIGLLAIVVLLFAIL